eukprot:TRINITY_DN30474_c0_g1_i2.p1 TRINITY_DN30474_c0_g1~~TRINITY_DN30474_c0_g1_i2.p1  ORF type:complete len:160 (-),score=25.58 TRINITY_DN30474_c0_g1_i2:90-521(-)
MNWGKGSCPGKGDGRSQGVAWQIGDSSQKGGSFPKVTSSFEAGGMIAAMMTKGLSFKGKGFAKGKQFHDKVDASKTIWVGNLPEGCRHTELLAHARQTGKATWAELLKGRGRGTAKIIFESAEEAEKALIKLEGSVIGVLLFV